MKHTSDFRFYEHSGNNVTTSNTKEKTSFWDTISKGTFNISDKGFNFGVGNSSSTSKTNTQPKTVTPMTMVTLGVGALLLISILKK